jgi:hypothetical protein
VASHKTQTSLIKLNRHVFSRTATPAASLFSEQQEIGTKEEEQQDIGNPTQMEDSRDSQAVRRRYMG